jgi:hypothetical protein
VQVTAAALLVVNWNEIPAHAIKNEACGDGFDNNVPEGEQPVYSPK